MLFGVFLRKERNKRNLSTQKFADMLGVSKSYVVLIETGKRRPGKGLLSKFAEVLEVDTKIIIDIYLEDIKADIHNKPN